MHEVQIYNTYSLHLTAFISWSTFPNFRSSGLRCIVCDVIHYYFTSLLGGKQKGNLELVELSLFPQTTVALDLCSTVPFSHMFTLLIVESGILSPKWCVLLLLFSCNYIFAPWEYRSLTASIWIFCRLAARNHEEPERSDLLETAWYLSVLLLEVNLGTHLNASANVLWITGTEMFWIKATILIEQLNHRRDHLVSRP